MVARSVRGRARLMKRISSSISQDAPWIAATARETCSRCLIRAIFLRTETELILKSRKVVLARLSEAGFTFEFPLWSQCRSRTLRSRAQTLLR